MPRKEFPKSVKVAAIKRAMRNGILCCEQCGSMIKGSPEIDHVIADGLGGENTLQNAAVLCAECHRNKTSKNDVPKIAKAKRLEARSLGVRKRTTLRSRGFEKVDKPKRMDKTTLPPRRMFEDQ